MSSLSATAVHRAMGALANLSRERAVAPFFKCGPGEYGEGDRFLGIGVPALRKLARRYQELSLRELALLLRSPWHEERLLALLILVRQYARGAPRRREAIYRLYLRSRRGINNWDLVDCSAEHIVGAHLQGADSTMLTRLAGSRRLWDRRIAVLATFNYIKAGEYRETLRLSRLLLEDPHDLIHKAVGWMLREVGKRDRAAEEQFLRRHAARMPRTMLRYAIERFPPALRRHYLAACCILFLGVLQAACRTRDSGFAALQRRGEAAMGVNQYTSSHVFEALPDGGRIVLQRQTDDSSGTATIRAHMTTIAEHFRHGDFAIPGLVHAQGVPGTQVMAARRTQISYRADILPRGGQVRITTDDPVALTAIHEFLAFQRREHHAAGHGH
jgi:3-methyladenine DNA glycosylase AlkD